MNKFTAFIKIHDASEFSSNATYWIGECLYAMENYEGALINFAYVIKNYPDGNKLGDSKLKIGYKFGLELLNSKKGRVFVSKLKNKIIFADLKIHDIPNTCISAVRAIKDLKVNYLTIHISSGLKAIKAAKKVSGLTKIIGVTILTSLDNKSLKEIGFDKDVKKLFNLLFFRI